jgi:prepilin-type N-terminal cleavage/methylation domain-containing protein
MNNKTQNVLYHQDTKTLRNNIKKTWCLSAFVAKRKGVTLVEMMIVVAIAALMLGLTIPAANMILNSFESESGAKTIISSALASARAIAAKEQRYAGIRFQKRYDPNNPDPLNCSQYMIFIVKENNRNISGNLDNNGFHAVDGIQPIKLPDSIGVMDLYYEPDSLLPAIGDGILDSDTEASNATVFTDATSFSIVFSPSGKLVIHEVRVRNRDGKTQGTEDTSAWGKSQDDVFNTLSRITNTVNPVGMFLQDDYYAKYAGSPVINLGLGPEPSRNRFIIYDTKKLKQADVNHRWTTYLSLLKPIYINPYTGTIVNTK